MPETQRIRHDSVSARYLYLSRVSPIAKESPMLFTLACTLGTLMVTLTSLLVIWDEKFYRHGNTADI